MYIIPTLKTLEWHVFTVIFILIQSLREMEHNMSVFEMKMHLFICLERQNHMFNMLSDPLINILVQFVTNMTSVLVIAMKVSVRLSCLSLLLS